MLIKSERDAHEALSANRSRKVTTDARVDWPMRQFVEDMQSRLRAHANHAQIESLMQARGVPVTVQRRILAQESAK